MGLNLRDIELETTVFHEPAWRAKPCSWRVGPVETIGSPGDSDFAFVLLGDKMMSAGDLPTEFFNHQLMACDCTDLDAIHDFVTRWGFPYSPYRYSPLGFRLLRRGRARSEAKEAIEATDGLKRGLQPTIALAEVRHAICSLQTIVNELHKAVAGDGHEGNLHALNAAACNRFIAGKVEGSKLISTRFALGGNYSETERLTSAICNQMIDALADETPWRLCACEGCGVIFKKKQSREARDGARRNSKYCSDTCQERQKKRNQSAGAKNRVNHGF